jgi:hypothetical protein
MAAIGKCVCPLWVELAISRSDPDWSIYGMKQTSVNAGQATEFGHYLSSSKPSANGHSAAHLQPVDAVIAYTERVTVASRAHFLTR